MSQTTAVETPRPIDNFKQMLEKSAGTIAAVLPKHLTPERIMKIATVAVSRTPDLMECTAASIVQAVVLSSQLGLEPGGPLGHAYMVPYRNNKTGKKECQFIPGYRGLIDLARRSGQVSSIEAHCVYEKDEWEYANTESGTKLRHVPFWDGDRGILKRVYAIARLKGSELPQIEVMSKSDVDKIRAKSKAKDSGPWVTDYDEMARKTVVRRIVKYLPMSVELVSALSLEDRAEGQSNVSYADLNFEAAEVLEDPDTAPTTRTAQLKEAMPTAPVAKEEAPASKPFNRAAAVAELMDIAEKVYGPVSKLKNQAARDWSNNMAESLADLTKAPDNIIEAALPNARQTLKSFE